MPMATGKPTTIARSAVSQPMSPIGTGKCGSGPGRASTTRSTNASARPGHHDRPDVGEPLDLLPWRGPSSAAFAVSVRTRPARSTPLPVRCRPRPVPGRSMPRPRCRWGSGRSHRRRAPGGSGRLSRKGSTGPSRALPAPRPTAISGRAAGRSEKPAAGSTPAWNNQMFQTQLLTQAAATAPGRASAWSRTWCRRWRSRRRSRSSASASRPGSSVRGWPPWRRPRRTEAQRHKALLLLPVARHDEPECREDQRSEDPEHRPGEHGPPHGALLEPQRTRARGCIVVDTTSRRSTPRASRSSSWRSCAAKPSSVRSAS